MLLPDKNNPASRPASTLEDARRVSFDEVNEQVFRRIC
jgi:hypothetical protein